MKALLLRMRHHLATCRKAWLAVALLATGWFARDAWIWATRPDPIEALLRYDDLARPPLTPDVDYSTYIAEEKEQYDPWDGGRIEMAWVAMEEVYGLSGIISSMTWRCAIYDYIAARQTMTEKQISLNGPAILPAYRRLSEALDRFAEVDSSFDSEKLDTLCSAMDAKLLARIVQYQIAKGGSGGDVEFDPAKLGALIDRQDRFVRARVSGDKEAMALNDALRAKYMKAGADVAHELRDWNPKCARLVVLAMNRHIEPFPQGE